MGRTLDSALKTEVYLVEDLVDLVTSGEVRIPSFQRGLRWTRKDVEHLFDSIIKGYPIGNFLLWRRPAGKAEDLRIGAVSINAPSMDVALFVVDGQQRLTSLSSALSVEGLQDPRFALSYDLLRDKFVTYAPGADPTQIPLPTLFDLTRLLRWFGSHESLQESPGLIDKANGLAKTIRGFRVPVYVVEQSDPEVLRDIFDRMNNSGKQLTRSEVFTALHEEETGERAQTSGTEFSAIAEKLHAETGFGILDDSTIFLAYLAHRGHDISRDIRREFDPDRNPPAEFPDDTPAEAGTRTEDALRRAVTFLQQDAGFPHFALLPNRYLLVVLARFFAHFPRIDPATARNLRRWTWRTAIRGPEHFKGSSSGAMRTLAAKITPENMQDSIDELLASVAGPVAGAPKIPVFNTAFATTRLLLTTMWSHGPQRLEQADQYERYRAEDLLGAIGTSATAAAQAPMLVRSTPLNAKERSQPANRVFLPDPPGALPDSPLAELTRISALSRAGDADAKAALESHLVSAAAASSLLDGDIRSFVSIRQRDLLSHFEKTVMARAEWEAEDTAPLASLEILDEEDARDDLEEDAELRLDLFGLK